MKLLLRKLRDRMHGLRGWLVPRLEKLLGQKNGSRNGCDIGRCFAGR